jgi:DNA polymerase-3 subunit alpha
MHIHLAAHSYYSLLAGIPKPSKLAAAAGKAGHSAIALTDRNRLSGAIEFTLACQTEGIKPIMGMEIHLDKEASARVPAILLAMDAEGWANLCRLSSWLLNEQYGESRALPADILQGHQEGLISIVSPRAEIELLSELKATFGDRLYLQLSADTGSLARRGKALIPAVAIWPIYYMKPEQAELQRVLSAIRLNTTIESLPDGAASPVNSYFPGNEEWNARFTAHPEAVAATEEIAERCDFELPLGKPIFPDLELPEGQTPIGVLRQKAYDGARRRYGELSEPITARLEHELESIQNSGYATLFLIMEEVIAFAREADVPISSRGSAASSLVAHCLGITTPDPMRLNLYFERFLNPARPTPPDIDTDICSQRRDIVIRHVFEKYGADRVAMVATINRFRRRSALHDVAKAHGLASTEIKSMVGLLPYRFRGPRQSGDTSARPFAELEARYSSEIYKKIFHYAEAILDMPNHLSIHPGGIVISARPLNDLVPTQFSTKGVTITQYDLEGVQQIGLVKMDLLGIRGLSVLGDVADQIRHLRPEMGKTRLEILERIPDRDPKVVELLCSGQTIGCFQIESPGMRATLQEVQPKNIDDIMVTEALFRPGPLQGGLKDAFIRRHLGKEDVRHIHPALAPLLGETLGVFLYQEQVLRVAHELAGFSLAESDLLRRAMSHFDPGKRMLTLKEKFIAGAWERKAVPADVGERIWEMMAKFAGYGFPKAHSASYALTAWRSAWCKTYYPAEFMAAVLANWGGYYSQETYIVEARRMGLSIRPPHINYSQSQFSVTYIDGKAHLFTGLDQVHDLTQKAQQQIQQERPFTSLADLMTRAQPRKAEAHNLIVAEALDGLGSVPDLLKDLKEGTWKRGQMQLFS